MLLFTSFAVYRHLVDRFAVGDFPLTLKIRKIKLNNYTSTEVDISRWIKLSDGIYGTHLQNAPVRMGFRWESVL